VWGWLEADSSPQWTQVNLYLRFSMLSTYGTANAVSCCFYHVSTGLETRSMAFSSFCSPVDSTVWAVCVDSGGFSATQNIKPHSFMAAAERTRSPIATPVFVAICWAIVAVIWVITVTVLIIFILFRPEASFLEFPGGLPDFS
jgi:hypothetical protein